MTNNINIELLFKLEPKEAIAYLDKKGLKVTTDWRELWEDAHAKAFTVSKMTDAELLSDTKSLLEKSLKEGWGEKKAESELTKLFKSKGWWGKVHGVGVNDNVVNTTLRKEIQLGSAHRVKTIYRQNIQSAYNARRYLKQLTNVDFAPYFQYTAVLDSATRPAHRALHGKVYRYDDPIWSCLYPPNGWGCRCSVRSLTESEVKSKGLKVETSGDNLSHRDVIINDETGETKQIACMRVQDKSGNIRTVETDAGWSSNTGKAAWNIDVMAYKSISKLPQLERDRFISEMAQEIHGRTLADYLIKNTLKRAGYGSRGVEIALKWLGVKEISALEAENIELQSPIIVFEDRQVKHSLGERKVAGQRLTVEQFKKVPEWIYNPDEVFIDTQEHALVYVKFLPKEEIIDGRNCVKIPVPINVDRTDRPVNYIGTTGRVNYKEAFSGKRYKKVE